jgi:hypothetical protein
MTSMEDSRMFRLFNVIDDFNREAIGMEVTSLCLLSGSYERAQADYLVARKAAGDSMCGLGVLLK